MGPFPLNPGHSKQGIPRFTATNPLLGPILGRWKRMRWLEGLIPRRRSYVYSRLRPAVTHLKATVCCLHHFLCDNRADVMEGCPWAGTIRGWVCNRAVAPMDARMQNRTWHRALSGGSV